MFEQFSKEAGKEQYLIPYFIAAHPGTRDEDMLSLALWLKANKFRLDQVQNFYPSPMASATAMYHSERNPLKKVDYKSEQVSTPKTKVQRQLHKAFLRYHDPDNWDMLRVALKKMGRADLIGSGKHQLVPEEQKGRRGAPASQPKFKGQRAFTQHTGLPPRHHGKKAKPSASSSAAEKSTAKNAGKGAGKAPNKSAAKPARKRVSVKPVRR